MNIVFRTDASLEIGTGHVMRDLTLAAALEQLGAECRFICRDLEGHLAERISERGFDVTLLARPQNSTLPPASPPHAHWAGVSWQQDATETQEVLRKMSPDWVVLDHYAFDQNWERHLRASTRRLMVIDDLADRPHVSDLLLDQGLGRQVADYIELIPSASELRVGLSYALLRPEFSAMRSQALRRRRTCAPNHILVSMGGVDLMDATTAVLSALSFCDLPLQTALTVVMGRHAPALEQVHQQLALLPWHTTLIVDTDDMANVMLNADLAIGAAGSTTWERCCLGLPTLMAAVAENQLSAVDAVAKAGAAIDLGNIQGDGLTHRLKIALAQLSVPGALKDMSDKAAQLCDGEGAQRIAQMLMISELVQPPHHPTGAAHDE